jgi:hypothetical protein
LSVFRTNRPTTVEKPGRSKAQLEARSCSNTVEKADRGTA